MSEREKERKREQKQREKRAQDILYTACTLITVLVPIDVQGLRPCRSRGRVQLTRSLALAHRVTGWPYYRKASAQQPVSQRKTETRESARIGAGDIEARAPAHVTNAPPKLPRTKIQTEIKKEKEEEEEEKRGNKKALSSRRWDGVVVWTPFFQLPSTQWFLARNARDWSFFFKI